MSENDLSIQNSKIEYNYEIRDKAYDVVNFDGVRFTGSITFINSEIKKLTISNHTKIKGNVIFKNCIFLDSVVMKKINCLGSLDFIDCQFQKSFKIYTSKIKGHFNLLDVQIEGDLLIQSLATKSLNIEEVTAKNIRLNSISESKILSINVNNSTIESLFDITETHETASIHLTNCNIGFLFSVQKIVNNSNLNIDLKNCYAKNLKINNNSASNEFTLNIIECITDKIQVTKCKADKGVIDFNNTSSSGISKISDVDKGVRIDLSSLTTSEMILDQSFYENIAHGGKLNSQLLLEDISQQLSTVQILEKYFHQKGDTRLQDKMTYVLRDLENTKNSIQNENRLMAAKVHYYIGKYLFGWGVELRQLFISFFFITLIFSLIYLTLMQSCGQFSFEFKEVLYTGVLAPFELSIFYMLGFYSDVKVSCINYLLGLSQHIIGLAYLTLIIGVGIRKLVN